MGTRQPPQQQAPPVQKLRLEYSKRGRARFASHRDFARALERAIRRAEIPMAYSSGFSPHPRISYPNAAPTGAASECEYVELGLARVVEPDWVQRVLGEALPLGLDIIRVVPAEGPSLTERLQASRWLIDVVGIPRPVMEQAVASLMGAEHVLVQRQTKAGVREFDVRPAVLGLSVVDDRTLDFTGRHDVPLVRADDVVSALAALVPEFVLARPALVTRLAQGPWLGDSIGDPLGT